MRMHTCVIRASVSSFLVVIGLCFSIAAQEKNPAKSDKSASKTFTETMRQNAEKVAAEQAAASQLMEEREKRLGVLGNVTSEEDKQLYEKSFQEFRDALVPMRKIYTIHQLSKERRVPEDRAKKYATAFQSAFDSLCKWRQQIATIYLKDPDSQPGLGDLMKDMLSQDGAFDALDGNLEIAQAIFKHGSGLSDRVLNGIGFVAYTSGDFDLAEEAWGRLAKQAKLSDEVRYALSSIPKLREYWAAELEARKADAMRDDNPQVAILTTKGEMIVELFENEAPEAVANFIYLTEKNFYQYKSFFRVMEHFGAQTGCEKGDGTTNPGYTIYDEMNLPNRRKVFRGSLVLISSQTEDKESQPNTGSSQILMTMVPQLHFDAKFTCFGRIIQGQNVLGSLQRIDLTDEKERKNIVKPPDYIISAKVIRKREHEYLPRVATGRLPF